MQVSNDNLQYIFACLVTHSKWVKEAKVNLSAIADNFTLTQKEKSLLRNFFDINAEKLLANSLLGEEKRWREFLTTIKYINKIISLDQLKNYWFQYLDDFLIDEAIPTTPLNESIRFLKFLLGKNISLLFNNLTKYELLRNARTLYEVSDCFNYTADVNNIIMEENLNKLIIILNPSFICNQFDVDILKVINKIDKNEDIDPYLELNKCYIGFYKHPESRIIKTIQLKQALLSALLNIKKEEKLNLWINKSLAKS